MNHYSKSYFAKTIWKEGFWFFVIPGIILLYDIINLILFSADFTFLDTILFVACLFLIGYTIFFLRPPTNFPPENDNNKIYASADGYIFSIEENVECPYIPDGQRYHKVIIFMHVASMHWNLSPVQGVIKTTKFVRGKFQNAFHAEKNWQENEHQVIVVETPNGEKVMVSMVAGLIARRIRFFKKEKDNLDQGNILGLIRYGSANVLYFPTSYKIQVHLKDKSRAGRTVVAQKGVDA